MNFLERVAAVEQRMSTRVPESGSRRTIEHFGDPSDGIDREFLAELEGRKTTAYVPSDDLGRPLGRSGVTVGTGFDVGQWTTSDIEDMLGDVPAIVEKLRPYVGLKRGTAQKILKSLPLELSEEEVDDVDKRVTGRIARDLRDQYNSSGADWDKLSPQQKTILYSVAHQYGPQRLPRRTPKFWNSAVRGDWGGVETELRNFGDAYTTRRLKEADYLARGGTSGPVQTAFPSEAFVDPPNPSVDPSTARTRKVDADEDGGFWQALKSVTNFNDSAGITFDLETGDIGVNSTPAELDLFRVYPDRKQELQQLKEKDPKGYLKLQEKEWNEGIRNPWEISYGPVDGALDLLFSFVGAPGFRAATKLGKVANTYGKRAKAAKGVWLKALTDFDAVTREGAELVARGAPEQAITHSAYLRHQAAARVAAAEANFEKKNLAFFAKRAQALHTKPGAFRHVTPTMVAREAAEQVGTSMAALTAYESVEETTDSPGAGFLTALGVAPLSAFLLRRGIRNVVNDGAVGGILGDMRGAVGKDIGPRPEDFVADIKREELPMTKVSATQRALEGIYESISSPNANHDVLAGRLHTIWERAFATPMEVTTEAVDSLTGNVVKIPQTVSVARVLDVNNSNEVRSARLFQEAAAQLRELSPNYAAVMERYVNEIDRAFNIGHVVANHPGMSKHTIQQAMSVDVMQQTGKGKQWTEFRRAGNSVRVLDEGGQLIVTSTTPTSSVTITAPKMLARIPSRDLNKDVWLQEQAKLLQVSAARAQLLNAAPIIADKSGKVDWEKTGAAVEKAIDLFNSNRVGGRRLIRQFTKKDREYIDRSFVASKRMAQADPNAVETIGNLYSQIGVVTLKDQWDKETLRQFDAFVDRQLNRKAVEAGFDMQSSRGEFLQSINDDFFMTTYGKLPRTGADARAMVNRAIDLQPQLGAHVSDEELDFIDLHIGFNRDARAALDGDPAAQAKLNRWLVQEQEAGRLARPTSKSDADLPVTSKLVASGLATESVEPAARPKPASLTGSSDPSMKDVRRVYVEAKDVETLPDGTLRFRDADGEFHNTPGTVVLKEELRRSGGAWHVGVQDASGSTVIRPQRQPGYMGGLPHLSLFTDKKYAFYLYDAIRKAHAIASGKIHNTKTFLDDIVSDDIARGFWANVPDERVEDFRKQMSRRVFETLGKADEDPAATKEALLDIYKVYLKERSAQYLGQAYDLNLIGSVEDFLEYDLGKLRLSHVPDSGVPDNVLLISPTHSRIPTEKVAFGEVQGRVLTPSEQDAVYATIVSDGVALPRVDAVPDASPVPLGAVSQIPGPLRSASTADQSLPPTGPPYQAAPVGSGPSLSGVGTDPAKASLPPLPPGAQVPPPPGGGGGPPAPFSLDKHATSPYGVAASWNPIIPIREAVNQFKRGWTRIARPWLLGQGASEGIEIVRGTRGRGRRMIDKAYAYGRRVKVKNLETQMRARMQNFLEEAKASDTLRTVAARIPWQEWVEAIYHHEAKLPQVDGVFSAPAKKEMIEFLDDMALAPMREWAKELGIKVGDEEWIENYWARQWDMRESVKKIQWLAEMNGELGPEQKAFLHKMTMSDVFGIVSGRSPVGSHNGFLRQRMAAPVSRTPNNADPLWAYYHEMLNLGFVPVVSNPVDQVLLKAKQMEYYLTRKQIIKEFEEGGHGAHLIAKFRGSQELDQANQKRLAAKVEPYVPVWAPPDSVLKPSNRHGWIQEFAQGTPPKEAQERGAKAYIVAAPESLAVILNSEFNGTRLFQELQGGKRTIYDTLRRVSNQLTGIQLGGSLFHLTNIAIEAALSDAALAVEMVATAMRPGGWQDLVKGAAAEGTTPYAFFLERMASFALPGKALLRAQGWGNRLNAMESAFYGFGQGSALEDYAALLQKVNGGFGRTSAYEVAIQNNWVDYVNKYKAGALNAADIAGAPADALQHMTGWMFETLVPRAKVDAFYHRMRLYFMSNPGVAKDSPEAIREAHRTWESIENRLGMMTYENQHWNSLAKDIFFLAQRAPGWNWGTVAEVGGGVKDLGSLAALKGKRAYEKVRYGRPSTQAISGVSKLTPRAGYATALFLGIPLYGGILQFLLTQELPPSFADINEEAGGATFGEQFGELYRQWVSPKTGGKRADGTPERWSLPGIINDIYGYTEHPIVTASHKVSPPVSIGADLIRNRNYYGQEIMDTEASTPVQVAQGAGHILQSILPFSWQGGIEAYRRGESAMNVGLAGVGLLSPAPARFAHTRAERMLYEFMNKNDPRGVMGSRAQERSELLQEYQRWRVSGRSRGDPMPASVREGLRSGRVTGKALSSVDQKIRLPKVMHLLIRGRYTPEQLVSVVQSMTPKELKDAGAVLWRRFALAKQGQGLTKEERIDIEARMREAVAEVRARASE